MKFRVKAGSHIENNGKAYKAGDTFEANVDRVAQFGHDKFERVHDFDQPSQGGVVTKTVFVTEATLKGMTLAELQSLAAEEEVAIGNAKTKEELVKVLKGALCS